ncbi:hypothetical protein [Vreelandella profundi]|uniref:hypothetical protein n=1 Tax=Vreelandella profundi TaxID=2852117 RepID=UPI001F451F09|nr:hypothetical protein [Halomonas profundi]
MANINYPDGLPIPLRADYGLEHTDNVLRTQLGNGRSRKEILHAPGPSEITAKFRMRPGQAQAFEGFYWHTLNSGILKFNMKLLSPLGIQVYEDVEFAELYNGPVPLSNSRGGEHRIWEFSAQLLLNKAPIVSAEEMQYPDEIIYSSIFDRTMNKHWPKT